MISLDESLGFQAKEKHSGGSYFTPVTGHLHMVTRPENHVVLREGASLPTLLRVLKERLSNLDVCPKVVVLGWSGVQLITPGGFFLDSDPNLEELATEFQLP